MLSCPNARMRTGLSNMAQPLASGVKLKVKILVQLLKSLALCIPWWQKHGSYTFRSAAHDAEICFDETCTCNNMLHYKSRSLKNLSQSRTRNKTLLKFIQKVTKSFSLKKILPLLKQTNNENWTWLFCFWNWRWVQVKRNRGGGS